MADYNLTDDNLIALSLIEAVINQNETQANLIENSIPPENLHKGLLITASSLVIVLSSIWNIPIEQTINKLREINQNNPTPPANN